MKKALFRGVAIYLCVALCMLTGCRREQVDRLPQELLWQSSLLQEETVLSEQQQYEALLKEAMVLQPGAQRTQLIREAEQMLLETGRIIPLLNETNSYLLRKTVQGYYRTVSGVSYFQQSKPVGNTLHACLDGTLESLDPALARSSLEKGLAANCFSGLYRENEQGEIQPELAQSCESSADGMTIALYCVKVEMVGWRGVDSRRCCLFLELCCCCRESAGNRICAGSAGGR